MTDKARELLERAQVELSFNHSMNGRDLAVEIRAYLAQPEVKREALSEREMLNAMDHTHYFRSFCAGVRFAEKHHGIGGGDE